LDRGSAGRGPSYTTGTILSWPTWPGVPEAPALPSLPAHRRGHHCRVGRRNRMRRRCLLLLWLLRSMFEGNSRSPCLQKKMVTSPMLPAFPPLPPGAPVCSGMKCGWLLNTPTYPAPWLEERKPKIGVPPGRGPLIPEKTSLHADIRSCWNAGQASKSDRRRPR
jgi:hypothetical protein